MHHLSGLTSDGIPPSESGADDQPGKKRSRQRLLQGISRMSSSPSLIHLGRHTPGGSAYGLSLSCISLGSPATPLTSSPPSSPGGLSTAPSSRPASPVLEIPPEGSIESVLGMGKVDRECCVPGPNWVTGKRPVLSWAILPKEIKLQILGFLLPKELVRVSRVSSELHRLCFDGQLWSRLDASEFYSDIPPDSLIRLIEATGPFIKDLNLRGCMQVESRRRADAIVAACRNVANITLEGCQNLNRTTLHALLSANEHLTTINVAGLNAVTNLATSLVGDHCPQLQTLNVSWCKNLDARSLVPVIRNCERLRDLRAGEVHGFGSIHLARLIFRTNRLEKLVLCGCDDLTDTALKTMIHGINPETDFATDRPLVPPRKLRYLDLSRCIRLTDVGIKALAYFVPALEGLQLNKCHNISSEGLSPLVASTPRLSHLELDEMTMLTNSFLSDHLSKSPCATVLEHLSFGYCENLGDSGMLPLLARCINLKSITMDNTTVSDLVLAAATLTVRSRQRVSDSQRSPRIGLRMDVYDCQNITWAGVREVLSRNVEAWHASTSRLDIKEDAGGEEKDKESAASYNAEIIALKCFYGWQMTVDEHMKRILRGDLAAASRLERKWAEYMQAAEEAGALGAGVRRRRRRARQAQQLHGDDEGGVTRRRARTCVVM